MRTSSLLLSIGSFVLNPPPPLIYRCNDVLEMELGRELENGRVVRLLCKLGFINERPEFDMDPSWSETGDRYLLKLFRDYVFHQVNEHGNPLLDMAHVLVCLNKVWVVFAPLPNRLLTHLCVTPTSLMRVSMRELC